MPNMILILYIIIYRVIQDHYNYYVSHFFVKVISKAAILKKINQITEETKLSSLVILLMYRILF